MIVAKGYGQQKINENWETPEDVDSIRNDKGKVIAIQKVKRPFIQYDTTYVKTDRIPDQIWGQVVHSIPMAGQDYHPYEDLLVK